MEAHVFTRHAAHGRHRAKPYHRGCKCPKWIYVGRERRRVSARTRSWARAEQKARLIAEGKPAVVEGDEDERTTTAQVIEEYLDDKRLQNLPIPPSTNSTTFSTSNWARSAATMPSCTLTSLPSRTCSVSAHPGMTNPGAKEETGTGRRVLPFLHSPGMDKGQSCKTAIAGESGGQTNPALHARGDVCPARNHSQVVHRQAWIER